jgi:hypothetical protein
MLIKYNNKTKQFDMPMGLYFEFVSVNNKVGIIKSNVPNLAYKLINKKDEITSIMQCIQDEFEDSIVSVVIDDKVYSTCLELNSNN